MLLLIFSPQAFSAPSTQPSPSSAATPTQYPDQGLSLLSVKDRITLVWLDSLTGGRTGIADYQGLIQRNFIQQGVRQVLLDIGWQNYSLGTISQQTWVENWLTASDEMGLENVLYAGMLTVTGTGSPWIQSLITLDPGVRTFNSIGAPVSFVSPDNPDLVLAVEKDLTALYSYYGSHSSWVGLGTGVQQSDPYFTGNSTEWLGFSNSTVNNFSNSVYYARDINATGYLPNGELDNIWQSTRAFDQSIVLSSGNWMTSTPEPVYGNATNQVAMRFYLPVPKSHIQLQWFGDAVGNPGILLVSIHADDNGTLSSNHLVGNANQTLSPDSTNPAWQPPISLAENFNKGFYWAVFSDPSGNAQSHYQVYMRDYEVNGAEADYIIGKNNLNLGSSILLVEDGAGSRLAVYPYQHAIGPKNTQSFLASKSFSFNTVFLFLSDRAYNPTNATLQVEDQTAGGKLLAIGTLSQEYTHGLENWTPVGLNATVTTEVGHTYLMTMAGKGLSWSGVLRGVHSDPSSGGFQNQSDYWLFELGNLNWSQQYWNYNVQTANGADAVRSGLSNAVQFTVPASWTGQAQTLTQVSVLMYSTGAGPATFPLAASLTVTISANDPGLLTPTGSPLQVINVTGNHIPLDGWLNATGFNVQLKPGMSYWAIFGTNSNQTFPMARLTNSYLFHSLVSYDKGKTWQFPREGPTDLAFAATFSNGKKLDNIVGISSVNLNPSVGLAQPFIAETNTQANGIFLGVIETKYPPNNFLTVSINQDNGTGGPSASALASGRLYSGNITVGFVFSFIQFTSIARLQAGTRYWIVITPDRGSFTALPVIYPHQQPGVSENLTAMVTNDNGHTWTKLTKGTQLAILSYAISAPTIPLISYNTKEISSDLISFHNLNVSSYPPRGWNAYVLSSELQTYSAVTGWLNVNGGSRFKFYTGINSSNLLAPYIQSIVSVPTVPSMSNCQNLREQLLQEVPTQDQQYKSFENFDQLQECGTNLKQLTSQLNYMLYPGPSFGTSEGPKVLVVGSQLSSVLGLYLSPAYKVSYLQAETDPSLASKGNLSDYAALVWLSFSNTPTAQTLMALQRYVDLGGNLVIEGSPASWLGNLSGDAVGTGLNQTGTPTQSVQIQAERLFGLWTSHTSYSLGLSTSFQADGSVLANGQNVTLGFNKFGNGTVSLIDPKGTGSFSFPQISNATILLSNALSSLDGVYGNSSPFWYEVSPTQSSGLSYIVQGVKGGPILVWAWNPTPSPQDLYLNLNGSYYGISTNWRILDPMSLKVTSRTGAVVSLAIDVQPESWSAEYILADSTEPVVGYASVNVVRHLVYPNQTLSYLRGSLNQSGIVALWYSRPIQSVELDDRANLSKVADAIALQNSSAGWFYDSTSSTLVVKFDSGGLDTLRVFASMQPPAPPMALPFTAAEVALVVLISAGMALFVYSAYSSSKSRRDGRKGRN